MKAAIQFLPGFLFGVGLAVSGMTNPGKVIAFLDVAGAWDPSLMLVMVGAIGAFAIINVLVHRRAAPVLGGMLPGLRSKGKLDVRLLLGAALFGVGWGLSGMCPGPAVTTLTTLTPELLIFLGTMVVGMVIAQRVFGADVVLQPVPRWTMSEAKRFVDTHKIDEYSLIDVRQPEEYAEGHLPGATLIPLSELPLRLGELDKRKTTLVYCRSGNRAGSATALLTRAGFRRAYNVGGIGEWNGLVAVGAPEAGMAVFDSVREPAEYIGVAWEMEEGARRFYEELGEQLGELKDMLHTLAIGEERHRDQLGALYREVTGQRDGEPSAPEARGMMEGGIQLEEALGWARTARAEDVLEFAAAMEANAHDRYITIGRAVGGATEEAFLQLAEAEKVHLNQLLEAFQRRRTG